MVITIMMIATGAASYMITLIQEWSQWSRSSVKLHLTWPHQPRVIITLRLITMMMIIWHDRSKGADPGLWNVLAQRKNGCQWRSTFILPTMQSVTLAQPKIPIPIPSTNLIIGTFWLSVALNIHPSHNKCNTGSLAQPEIHDPHCWVRYIQHILSKLYIKFQFDPWYFLVPAHLEERRHVYIE